MRPGDKVLCCASSYRNGVRPPELNPVPVDSYTPWQCRVSRKVFLRCVSANFSNFFRAVVRRQGLCLMFEDIPVINVVINIIATVEWRYRVTKDTYDMSFHKALHATQKSGDWYM